MMETNKVFILPWHLKSKGSEALSKELGIKRIRLENSSFTGSQNRTVINWGSSKGTTEVNKCRLINKPTAVKKMANKLEAFKVFKGKVSIPEFTEDLEEALTWVRRGKTVLARRLLKGSSGKGIVFINNLEDFVEANLYTLYKKKKHEFRVHVAFGETLLVQQKALRKTDDAGREINPKDVDFRVRSHKNGFVFKRFDISIPEVVLAEAEKALSASGLDFGAVDVIYNESEGKAYVLEINCAPGLEGETIRDYANVFRRNL